ncbi:spore germination protein [Paenibacillus marinisediminis]
MTDTSTEPTDWLELLRKHFEDCDDITIRSVVNQEVTLIYFECFFINAMFHQVVTDFLEDAPVENGLNRMMNIWDEVYGHNQDDQLQNMASYILDGKIGAIYDGKLYYIDVGTSPTRSIQPSMKETSISGPHEAFVERATTNLSLIRSRLQTTELKVQQYDIGTDMPITVYMIYLKNQTSPAIVNEAVERLSKLRMKQALDTIQVAKRIEDFPYSFFPQWLVTERPDTVCLQLMKGKIVIIADGSPSSIIAPVSFLDFFGVIGDLYERWHFEVLIRILRLLSIAITLLFSATYVAITTFHYQFIPPSILATMVQSRLKVPFEPMYEALLMEGVIEVLREASTRLPNKIAQSIGIVGGLVLGQAVVQAGLAGNVLIVAVAAGALSSFIMPSYTMETSFRILKFIMIIFAGTMGYFGILIFLALLTTHLCHLTSLKQEYLKMYHFVDFLTEGKEKLLNSALKGSSESKQGG